MNQIPLAEYRQQVEAAIVDGRHDEAVAHGRHILKHYPKDVGAYWLLGKAMLEAGQDEQAADMFQRVVSADPDRMLAWVGMGEVAERQGDLEAAIRHLERAFELATDNDAVASHLRHLYGKLEGREPDRLQLTQGALARLYLRGDLLSRAITELTELLEDHPDRIDLQVALAEALWRSGRRPEAAEVCQDILEDHRYNLKANLILGETWTSSGREGGEVYLERAEALDPENRAAQELFGAASPLPLKEPAITPAKYDAARDSGGVSWADGGPAIKVGVAQWLRQVVGGPVDEQPGCAEVSEAEPEEIDVDRRLEWMDASDEPETQPEEPEELPRREPGDDRLAWLTGPEDKKAAVPAPVAQESEEVTWAAEADEPDVSVEEPDAEARYEPEPNRLAWLTELEEEKAQTQDAVAPESEDEGLAWARDPDEAEGEIGQPDDLPPGESSEDRLAWLTESEEEETPAEEHGRRKPGGERLAWLTELEDTAAGAELSRETHPEEPRDVSLDELEESGETTARAEVPEDRDSPEAEGEELEWLAELERTDVGPEQLEEAGHHVDDFTETEGAEDLERAEIPDWLEDLAPLEWEQTDEAELDALAALLERDVATDDVLSLEEAEEVPDFELSDIDDLAWLEQLTEEQEEELLTQTEIEGEVRRDETEHLPETAPEGITEEMATEPLERTPEGLAALEPAAEESTPEEPGPMEPGAQEPEAEEPEAEELPVEEGEAVEPKPEEVVAGEPGFEEPGAEGIVSQETEADQVTPETPVAEEPPAEEPVAEGTAGEALALEDPTAREPGAEEPGAEAPRAEEAMGEQPTLEPVSDEPQAEEEAREERSVQEPVGPAPPVVEARAVEPRPEEVGVEKPQVEEPETEEPRIDESEPDRLRADWESEDPDLEPKETEAPEEAIELEPWEDATELPEWLDTGDLPLELDVLAWLEQLSEGEEEELRLQAEAEREARAVQMMREVEPAPEEAVPDVEEVVPEDVVAPPDVEVAEAAASETDERRVLVEGEMQVVAAPPPGEDLEHFIARQRDRVKARPEDREARLELGRVLWQADRLDEAMEAYGTLIDQEEMLEEIILDLEDYAAHQPDPSVKQTLGDAYVKADRLEDALEVYREALTGL